MLICFQCRKCNPDRPAPWEQIIKREFHAGIKFILDNLLSHRAASQLEAISDIPSQPVVTQDNSVESKNKKTVAKRELTSKERKSARFTRQLGGGIETVESTREDSHSEDQQPSASQTAQDEMAEEAGTVTISLTEAMQAMSDTAAECDTEPMDTVETSSSIRQDVDCTAVVDTAESTVADTDAPVSMDTNCDTPSNAPSTDPISVLTSNPEQDTVESSTNISPTSTASTLSTRLSFDDLTSINVSMQNAEELGMYVW